MKYVICSGLTVLKHLTIFNSVEECIEYIRFVYRGASIKGKRLHSRHVLTDCYTFTLSYEGTYANIDLLIYGCEEYAKKEEI